jgi:hypothetical protein
MKILIKESQYKVLLEQSIPNTQNSSAVGNTNIQKAYSEIIKGAKFILGTGKETILKAFDYIKNTQDFKTLLSMFKDKKTGYGSFEEMVNEEYDRHDYSDIMTLRDKLYKIGVVLNFTSGENYVGNDFFLEDVTISYNTNIVKNAVKVNNKCMSKYPSLLKQAQDYWVKWLSSPVTKQKFRKNWNVQPRYDKVDGELVSNIFEKYLNCINKLKLVYFDNTMLHPPGHDKIDLVDSRSAMAFVTELEPEYVFVNCSIDDEDPLGSMIHEIQHLLYDIKPLNPSIDVKNVFLKPGDKKLGPVDFFKSNVLPSKNINNYIINASKTLGVDEQDLIYWSKKAKSFSEDDPGYVCRETEKASNIQSVRHLLGIKPGQNITLQMLKPYINGEIRQTDMSWILMCWASKGFKDINLFLSDINKLAFQDTKPTDNTRPV